jgi:hypothetical protein
MEIFQYSLSQKKLCSFLRFCWKCCSQPLRRYLIVNLRSNFLRKTFSQTPPTFAWGGDFPVSLAADLETIVVPGKPRGPSSQDKNLRNNTVGDLVCCAWARFSFAACSTQLMGQRTIWSKFEMSATVKRIKFPGGQVKTRKVRSER